jgi:hypothetical protein
MQKDYGNFEFVNEVSDDKKKASMSHVSSSTPISGQSKISVEEQGDFELDDQLAEKNYCINLTRLSVMWTAASFNSYLLIYLNKYLAGTIYLDFYLEGIASIVAYILGAPLYRNCKTKISFIIALAVTLIGSIGIYMFEAQIISPYFIDDLGCPPSPYPPESEKDRNYHLALIIPWFSFTAKVGANLTMYCAYQASYANRQSFPILKRSTAIGICNLIARGSTILAPVCAELDKPIPSLILIIVSLIALLVSLTFPSEAQLKSQKSKLAKKLE